MMNNAASESPSAEVLKPNAVAEKVKAAIADGLSDAACAIKQRTGPGHTLEPLRDYGRQASELLEASADYVRSIEPDQIKENIEAKVRANPGRTLVIAAAAGLFLGIVIRRSVGRSVR